MHILVVEDEEEIAKQIKRGLEEVMYTITVSSSGEEALQKISHSDYDLIILDLLLPGIDGIETCREIRRSNNNTPILILTSQSDIISKVQGLDAGADDYLCKPFSFDELIARVRALLRRRSDKLGNILKIKNVALDTIQYLVSVNEKVTTLTKQEYKILEYLMINANRVCTKLMLEEHVWGARHEQESNVIEVALSRLRKKLEDAGADGFIQTRHGLGYVVND